MASAQNSIARTLQAIKAAGMHGRYQPSVKEYRVTYPAGEMTPARLEAVAAYTSDPDDAIATARAMRKRWIVIWKGGKRVAASRNLRGVLTYARRHGVTVWSQAMTDGYKADVSIAFADGASAGFMFNSWDVAQRWIRARRSWNLEGASIRPTFEGWRAA